MAVAIHNTQKSAETMKKAMVADFQIDRRPYLNIDFKAVNTRLQQQPESNETTKRKRVSTD